jgi:alpha-glucosidase
MIDILGGFFMQGSYVERFLMLSRLKYNYLNFDAVFSDETAEYRMPVAPHRGDTVEVKLRAARDNLSAAYVCIADVEYPMSVSAQNEYFDYYTASFVCGDKPISYFFKLVKDDRTYFYNKNGVYKSANPDYNFMILPDFHTPDWAKGAVIYQIFVDRFCNGDKSNDVLDDEYLYLGQRAKAVKDWNKPLENMDICNFYGGDLQGVIDKLDYLSDLGVDCLYLNPIFVSPSTHKYDIQDYDYVDPHFGVIVNDGGAVVAEDAVDNSKAERYIKRTCDKENLEKSNELFATLVDKAHKRGIRVILDGVFNHCGAFNKWLDREGFYEQSGYEPGAFGHKDSPYYNYFKWNNDGNYDGWWGHSNHPKLNYEKSPELYNYILKIAKKWVSPPYNCDGWRLDVAADLGMSREFNHKFWKDFRKAVKSANPEAIILAEHYGNPQEWLMGDEWDTVMNYDAFMEPVTWFLTGMEKHSESEEAGKFNNPTAFEGAMRYYNSRFSYESLYVAMNELSNHDHSRFLTRTNHHTGRLHLNGAEAADSGVDRAVMKLAITMQLTWPGAPTIYYGDEVGMTGWTDPDNRRPFPWGAEDKHILNYYKAMIALHKRYKAILTGSLSYLYLDYGLICYGRWDSEEKLAVIINNGETHRSVEVPVWRLEMLNGEKMYEVISSHRGGYETSNKDHTVTNGTIKIDLTSKACVVLANVK